MSVSISKLYNSVGFYYGQSNIFIKIADYSNDTKKFTWRQYSGGQRKRNQFKFYDWYKQDNISYRLEIYMDEEIDKYFFNQSQELIP